MQTIQLQMNKKIAALSYELPYEAAVVRYLFAMVGIIIFLYLYFVSASVLNVIAQREASQASAQMQSDIGVLEGKYFSLSQEVTRTQASKLGLTELTNSSFVYRLDTVGVVPSTKNAI